jgi:hypothetical protein
MDFFGPGEPQCVNACGFLFPARLAYRMTENPFSSLDLHEAIDLRWTLRDIKAQRWVLSPISPSHLQKLIAMGLVEMRAENHPVLTNAGLDALL